MNRAPRRLRFSFAALVVLAGVIALVTARTAQPMSPPTPAPPAVLRVGPGGVAPLDGSAWQHAFPDLDSALSAAVDGDEIWIAQGTWGPSNPSTGFVINKRLRIYGAFRGFEVSVATRAGLAAQTILTAQKPGPYPLAPHVIAISNVTSPSLGGGPGVLLDSVLIRDGSALGTGTDRLGAGIYSVDSDVDLTDCIVKANIADSNGGGLYFEGTGISSSANTMHVLGCEFFGNRTALGEGGAIYGSWVKGDVLNSTFTSNSADVGSGGAMSLTNMGASNLLTVANTVFWNNSANGTSISGGAVNLGESQPNVAHAANATFVNCTMADNVVGACVDGQAIYISTYSAPNSAIYNCILALNGGVGCPTSNPIGEGAAATVQYTDCYVPPPVIVLHGGTGNIQGDPLFRNHGVAGGLTLKALSPCIDSADYVQIPADIHDLDGDGDFAEKLPLDLLYQNRLINRIEPDTGHADPGYPGSTYLDMGAYEKP